MRISRMLFIDSLHAACRAYKRAINNAPPTIYSDVLRKRAEEAVLESIPFAKENGNELLGMFTDRVAAIYQYEYDKDFVGVYREMEYSWEMYSVQQAQVSTTWGATEDGPGSANKM